MKYVLIWFRIGTAYHSVHGYATQMDSLYVKVNIVNRRARVAPHGASHSYLHSVMRFYYVYILQSKPSPTWIYVGFTENLKKRFAEHNYGESSSTKSRKPYKLIHYEAYANITDAKRRELYLKTTKGKTTLRTCFKISFVAIEQ